VLRDMADGAPVNFNNHSLTRFLEARARAGRAGLGAAWRPVLQQAHTALARAPPT
jgi:hypothetical protein